MLVVVVVVVVAVVLDLANNGLNSRNSKPGVKLNVANMQPCYCMLHFPVQKNKKFLHPVALLMFNKCMNFH